MRHFRRVPIHHRVTMADTYVSLTMALPEGEVPERLDSLEDLSSIYKEGEALVSFSRKNWLIDAVETCAAHYGSPRLSYLSPATSLLNPAEAELAARELGDLLQAIERNPTSLSVLLGQDAGSDQDIRAMLQMDASPWGPLAESDDGDELHYLLSFLACQRALLRYAVERKLHVAFAQTAP